MRTRWKLQNLGRWVGLLALSVGVTVLVFLGGIVLLAWQTGEGQASRLGALRDVSQALTQEADGSYTLQNFDLPQDAAAWMLLLDADGNVVWQWNKPDELPTHYTLGQVASFSRWYLMDYPVQSLVRGDGLLLAGQAKGSLWKYSVEFSQRFMARLPGWLLGMFFLALFCVLALAALLLRRQFRREQRGRDEARSNWISGVSHDIRTPLSMVMGYAGQLEENPALPEQARKQVAIIRRQSQTIRDLVNDLNLTMRLDCEMQALRKAPLELAPFLRQTAADFLNSGLEHEVDLDLRLPKAPLPRIEADAFLLRRALNNLLLNAARHAPPGSVICLGVTNSVGAAAPCGPNPAARYHFTTHPTAPDEAGRRGLRPLRSVPMGEAEYSTCFPHTHPLGTHCERKGWVCPSEKRPLHRPRPTGSSCRTASTSLSPAWRGWRALTKPPSFSPRPRAASSSGARVCTSKNSA